jgi:hypothetical protein
MGVHQQSVHFHQSLKVDVDQNLKKEKCGRRKMTGRKKKPRR